MKPMEEGQTGGPPVSRADRNAVLLLILLTGVARRGLSGPRARRITDRATGAVLIAFGAKLAASG